MASFGFNASLGLDADLELNASLGLGLSAASSLVANMTGARADPYQVFNFKVEIEGIEAGGFSECSGLQVETEMLDYREGGRNDYVHRFAGPTRYPPLILKHGLSQIEGLWEWHQDIIAGRIKRRNGTIYLLDKQRQPAVWWDFKEAFPVKWTGPELRADSGTVAFESIELTHRGLSRPTSGGLVASLGLNISAGIGISASLDLDISLGF